MHSAIQLSLMEFQKEQESIKSLDGKPVPVIQSASAMAATIMNTIQIHSNGTIPSASNGLNGSEFNKGGDVEDTDRCST